MTAQPVRDEHLTATWHEARAADLLRPRPAADRIPPIARVVAGLPSADAEFADRLALAAAHIALAQSLRTGELARAVVGAGRANWNGLDRLADKVGGLRR